MSAHYVDVKRGRMHLEVRGQASSPFQRLVWKPHVVGSHAILIKLPDGTCLRASAGVVTDVWIVGESNFQHGAPGSSVASRSSYA